MNNDKEKSDINKKEKNCFIITPIGQDDTQTRKRTKQWKKLIYEPTLGDEFNIIIANDIVAPGDVMGQILHHVAYDDLVIIDYTELNNNVMYEAAIRHLSGKPFIQIQPNNVGNLPFDIQNWRVIRYDPYDLEHPKKLCESIKKSYNETKDPEYKVPELLPIRFDFDKIVSDPEKFVELLKKHFIKRTGEDDRVYTQPNIIEVYDPPMGTISGLFGQRRITCPRCKIIQYVNNYGTATVTSMYAGNKHYQCTNCGAEFDN